MRHSPYYYGLNFEVLGHFPLCLDIFGKYCIRRSLLSRRMQYLYRRDTARKVRLLWCKKSANLESGIMV